MNFLAQSPLNLQCESLLPPFVRCDVSMCLISQVGNELFRRYFPNAARFFQGVDRFWQNKTDSIVNMEFGFFYTMAINLPMTHEVKVIPHVDGMNLAFGPCAIMPFGEPASISLHNCSFTLSQDFFHLTFEHGWSTIAFV